MKKLISSLLIFCGILIFSQITDSFTTYETQNNQRNLNKEIGLVNPVSIVDGIISIKGKSQMKFKPEDIAAISVYKDAKKLPSKYQSFSNLISNGIIIIDLKRKFDVQTIKLEDLNTEKGFEKENSVFINQREFFGTDFKVLKDEIDEISVIDVKGKNHVAIYSTSKIDTEIR